MVDTSTSTLDPRALVAATLARGAARVSTLRCAVLWGGESSEREVSQVSASGICSALATPTAASPQRLAQVRSVELDAAGRWHVDGRALAPTQALEALGNVDVFFLGLHGGRGENGTLQGLLASASRAYTGSGVAASAACMDKWLARAAASSVGVAVARAARVELGSGGDGRRAALDLCAAADCVVKPRRGGSSVATRVVRALERAALHTAVDEALETGDDALVEELIDGVEITVPVLQSQRRRAALMPVEIRPAEGRFFDYQQKYSPEGARELCPPERLCGDEVRAAQSAALELHALLDCGSYSRIDFIVARHGAHAGRPVFLEVNTLPGFTPRSLLPQSAAWHAITYRELCVFLVLEALDEHARARAS
jgi:D-alanine-D-alanine ligase